MTERLTPGWAEALAAKAELQRARRRQAPRRSAMHDSRCGMKGVSQSLLVRKLDRVLGPVEEAEE